MVGPDFKEIEASTIWRKMSYYQTLVEKADLLSKEGKLPQIAGVSAMFNQSLKLLEDRDLKVKISDRWYSLVAYHYKGACDYSWDGQNIPYSPNKIQITPDTFHLTFNLANMPPMLQGVLVVYMMDCSQVLPRG